MRSAERGISLRTMLILTPHSPFRTPHSTRFRSSITQSPDLLNLGMQVGVLPEAPVFQGVMSAADGPARNREDAGASPATLTISECGTRNAECGVGHANSLFIPRSAFRIPHLR